MATGRLEAGGNVCPSKADSTAAVSTYGRLSSHAIPSAGSVNTLAMRPAFA